MAKMAGETPVWQRRHLTRRDEVKTVCIFGGTHGNEKTALPGRPLFKRRYCFRRYRETFSTLVEISNPAAVQANTRYVDTDMNRCFLANDLNDVSLNKTVEHRRAKELNAHGPKDSSQPKVDYLIDLHNTTSN